MKERIRVLYKPVGRPYEVREIPDAPEAWIRMHERGETDGGADG